MIIAVDAMGGDNAPSEIVKGVIQALREQDGFDVLLLGDEPQIREVLNEEHFESDRIKIRHTTEVITCDDVPTKAIKNKKDSSIVVGFELVRDHEADCLLSAGSSGALLAGSVLILKRIKGVDRPAVASIIPTKNGKVLLLDSGFNTNVKPLNYEQFGRLGTAYMRSGFGIENPKVGLVNIGLEEEKGTDTVKEAHALLKAAEDVNYVGYIESRELFNDVVDIAVTDGFTGNLMLKLLEGATDFFFGEIKGIFTKNLLTKISFLGLKKHLKAFKKKLDPDTLGGAPVLGVEGLVVKSHGSSKAKTIKYALLKAKTLVDNKFVETMKSEISVSISK